jgi:hypothetical protein
MSKVMLTVALMLGSVGLVGGSAPASSELDSGNRTLLTASHRGDLVGPETAASFSAQVLMARIENYGPFLTQGQADRMGQYEIDHHHAVSYGAGYLDVDPEYPRSDRGPGFYVTVCYP